MRVLVYEPDHGGHRMTYLGQLLPPLVELADVTLVLGKEAPASSEFEAQLGGVLDRIEIDAWVPPAPREPLASGKARAETFAQSMKRHRADHVYIPTADGMAQVMGWNRWRGSNPVPKGTQVEACMHRGGFAYPTAGLKAKLRAEFLRRSIQAAPFDVVHFVDVLVTDWLADHPSALSGRSRLLADPVGDTRPMDTLGARRALGIEEGGRWIGCAGGMDERKGIDLLVRAFARAAAKGDIRDDDRLLLVGKVSQAVRPSVEDAKELVNGGRIHLIDRYVSDGELLASLGSMDVVCTPYPSHIGLSNISLRSVAAHRPVLASTWGWLGEIVPRFGLGWTCDVRDDDAFARAIGDALDRSASYERPEVADRLIEFHSRENFGAMFTARLRERLGLGPDPALRAWSWVTGER